jgi:preprotein translocase subunit SecG
MSILIGILTFILVVNCLFLILLVLVQLPKKEAGAGVAFGAGTTDALFGAGSGNVLTKITKYCAGIFLVLAMLLSVLNIHQHSRRSGGTELDRLLNETPAAPATTIPTAPAPGNNAAAGSNVVTNVPLQISTDAAPLTNSGAAPAPAPKKN